MSPQAGQQLAHYRLIEQIGEGGMGVVWRAKDTTLDRDVAIKLLPEMVSADSERLKRLEREARLLASLNHPHIATIHGLHEAPQETGQPVRFLVMELVEGEDLQQRIEREPVPLERAIEIATQIAMALEVAHAQGVIHRDLKPANVKLTASGDAKVLDFGLAKALAPDTMSGEAAPSMSPTITSGGTAAGTILGTAAYMSPEQARGKAVDRRSDMWAFGSLLYEMLAGRRAFEGETISDTLASVLKEQPDWSRLPEQTPPGIRRLLRRCLAKHPKDRLGDAAAARLELKEAREPAYPGEQPVAVSIDKPAAPAKGGWIPWAVAGVAVLAAIGIWMTRGGDAPLPAPAGEPMTLSISVPSDIKLNDDQEAMLELSPDGRNLVFAGFGGEPATSGLFVRKLDDGTILRLPNTEDAMNPFFSPDGKWVGFFADGQIRKVQIEGGTPVPVCDVDGTPRGASWGDDDVIVFPQHFSAGLSKVHGAGGTPTPLTELDAERRERTHRWPHVVSEHNVAFFTVATMDSPEFYDDAHIDTVRLDTGERKTVFEGASFARYVPTGHLVIGRGGFLFAVPFDIEKLETTGAQVPVVEDVMGAAVSGVVYATIADNGLLAYVPGASAGPAEQLTWMHADGTNEGFGDTANYRDPEASPDGKYVAVAVAGDRSHDIWVFDPARGSRARLTFEGDNATPVWTPDGKSLFFYSIRDGLGEAWVTSPHGSEGERLFDSARGGSEVTHVSPDGKTAILSTFFDGKSDIFVKPVDAGSDVEATPFIDTPADERQGRFSPDGRFVAYASDEAGDYHVFVRPYPGPGGRWQISSQGGIHPRWSPDGKQIHYRDNQEWWVVDVEPGGDGQTFRVGVPRLVRNDLPRTVLESQFDMSRDGQAMLVPLADNRGVPTEITVVVDWFSELRDRSIFQK